MINRCLLFSGIAAATISATHPDETIKGVIGSSLRLYFSAMETFAGKRMSNALMEKCVTQDREPFTEDNLLLVSPDYVDAVATAVESNLLNLADPENHPEVQTARVFYSPANLERAMSKVAPRVHAARNILSTGSGSIVMETMLSKSFLGTTSQNDPLNSERPDRMSNDLDHRAIISDFSRAVGDFTLRCENYKCQILDYFDFEVDTEQSNFDRLIGAGRAYSKGSFDRSATLIGQMFCQEGLNEQPTETSIAVNIDVDLLFLNRQL